MEFFSFCNQLTLNTTKTPHLREHFIILLFYFIILQPVNSKHNKDTTFEGTFYFRFTFSIMFSWQNLFGLCYCYCVVSLFFFYFWQQRSWHVYSWIQDKMLSNPHWPPLKRHFTKFKLPTKTLESQRVLLTFPNFSQIRGECHVELHVLNKYKYVLSYFNIFSKRNGLVLQHKSLYYHCLLRIRKTLFLKSYDGSEIF